MRGSLAKLLDPDGRQADDPLDDTDNDGTPDFEDDDTNTQGIFDPNPLSSSLSVGPYNQGGAAPAVSGKAASGAGGGQGFWSSVKSWFGSSKSLNNGDSLGTDAALGAALDHLGPGYRQVAPGVFKSADGKRLVRMTDSDLSKKNNHAGGPHMNFETGISFVKPSGKESFATTPGGNMHIYLPEEN